jgi:TRAP-type C4-dicarboxylate transport system permease small subunit
MNQPSDNQTVIRPEPWLVRLLDRLTHICYTLSGLMLLLLAVMYLMEVFLRYVLNSPTVWSIDMISYTLCAMVSMAAPELARNNMHISITLVPDGIRNRHKRRNYVRVLTCISALVIGYVVYVTGGETYKLFDRGILTVGTFMVPKWWIAVFIPVGLFLTAAQYIRLTIYGVDSVVNTPTQIVGR